MSRYIDADLLKQKIDFPDTKTGIETKKVIEKWIDLCPTENVKKVVDATWLLCGMFVDFGKCSRCEWETPMSRIIDDEMDFCPHCGARMVTKTEYDG